MTPYMQDNLCLCKSHSRTHLYNNGSWRGVHFYHVGKLGDSTFHYGLGQGFLHSFS